MADDEHGEALIWFGKRIHERVTKFSISTPVSVSKISIGFQHYAFLSENGDVYVSGRNCEGQLGLGHCNEVLEPTRLDINNGQLPYLAFFFLMCLCITLVIAKFIDVACGLDHTVVVTIDNLVFACGDSKNGQCSLPPGKTGTCTMEQVVFDFKNCPDDSPSKGNTQPTICSDKIHVCVSVNSIKCLTDKMKICRVESGFNHNLALTLCGKVWCWGKGNALGINDANTVVSSPRLMQLMLGKSVRDICAGSFHSIALVDGTRESRKLEETEEAAKTDPVVRTETNICPLGMTVGKTSSASQLNVALTTSGSTRSQSDLNLQSTDEADLLLVSTLRIEDDQTTEQAVSNKDVVTTVTALVETEKEGESKREGSWEVLNESGGRSSVRNKGEGQTPPTEDGTESTSSDLEKVSRESCESEQDTETEIFETGSEGSADKAEAGAGLLRQVTDGASGIIKQTANLVHSNLSYVGERFGAMTSSRKRSSSISDDKTNEAEVVSSPEQIQGEHDQFDLVAKSRAPSLPDFEATGKLVASVGARKRSLPPSFFSTNPCSSA